MEVLSRMNKIRRPGHGYAVKRARAADPWVDPWSIWSGALAHAMALGDLASTGTCAAAALHECVADRAARLIDQARRGSRLYARHYRQCPPRTALAGLPAITKAQLMAQFDDWSTDAAITRAGVARFVADAGAIGADYLGRYAVWTSSGTCGMPGFFVQPRDALAVYNAELAARCQPGQLSAAAFAPMLPAAMIAATDGHYAGIVSWRRLQRAAPWMAPQMHALSVQLPLDDIVARLNRIRPRFISAYSTVLHALSGEQQRGALHIAPALLWSGGECLTRAMRDDIHAAFGCALINDYGASECMSIGFECAHGRMHLNADWVVLEPVDERYRAVAPGQASHTCLLTNLANAVQPLIRYDLGDSITEHAAACACGCALPSFSVSGRAADVLHLRRCDGTQATLFPLAVQSAIEEGSGITRFQIVQAATDRLLLRVKSSARARATVQRALAALRGLLALHRVDRVAVELDTAPIAPEGGSGKLRQIIALPSSDEGAGRPVRNRSCGTARLTPDLSHR